MWMSSFTNQRTPTRKVKGNTQTSRVARMCGRVRGKTSTCINYVTLWCGGIDVVKVLIDGQIRYATRLTFQLTVLHDDKRNFCLN